MIFGSVAENCLLMYYMFDKNLGNAHTLIHKRYLRNSSVLFSTLILSLKVENMVNDSQVTIMIMGVNDTRLDIRLHTASYFII